MDVKPSAFTRREELVSRLLSHLPSSTLPIYQTFSALFNTYHSLITTTDRTHVDKNKDIKLPNQWVSTSTLRQWSVLPILTTTVPVRSLAWLQQHSHHFTHIHSFGTTYKRVATGITAPLKLTCIGNDGLAYDQILKQDEIRSDCVIQQLFELINQLLETSALNEAKGSWNREGRSPIHLRTYQVGEGNER